jgi:6-bladed beta-propeller
VLLRVAPDAPLGEPTAVEVWNGRIAIADAYGHNVKVFDRDGSLALTLGRAGDGPGEFRSPGEIAVISGGRLAVTDVLHSTVTFFDRRGRLDGGFQVEGAAIGGLRSVDGGEALLLSARLLTQDGRASSPYALHVVDLEGTILSSFAERPAPLSITEGAFHEMKVAVVGDSLALWGVLGRPQIVRGRLDGSMPDTLNVRGIPWPDWESAPRTPQEIMKWTSSHLMWLMKIIPMPQGYLVRFQGGDALRGKEWQEYVFLGERGDFQLLTERTDVILLAEDQDGGILGIEIDDKGDAYLSSYRFIPPPARTID